MKPPSGTFAENALEHGVAGINVDAGRVDLGGDYERHNTPAKSGLGKNGIYGKSTKEELTEGRDLVRYTSKGRWPPNVALTHLDGCRKRGVKRVKGSNPQGSRTGSRNSGFAMGDNGGHDFTAPDGTETVADWDCADGCPVAELDRMSGESSERPRTIRRNGNRQMDGWGLDSQTTGTVHADTGGASRFFYTAKAHRLERQAGLPDGMTNDHPTVKPLSIALWICRMLLPPPGDKPRRILVPFAGSGSECIAAALAGWDEVIGVEMNREYVDIARARVNAWLEAAERTGSRDVDTLLDYFRGAKKARQERRERIEAGQLPLPLGGSS